MKKVLKIVIILLLITITSLVLFLLNKDQEIYKEVSKEENKFLTLMLEKEAGTGIYEESNSSFPQEGYYFNEQLSKCENGSKIKYNKKDQTVDVYTTKSDKCYAYFDYDKLGSICRGQNMAECFTQNYKKDSSIIYHDGKADYAGEENYELEADDLSYRYTGASEKVNNYVCFGSDDEKCPVDNLYRIVGLFKNAEGKYETKLIKADYANKDLLGSGTTKPSGTIDYTNNGSFYSGVYNKTIGSNEEKDAFTHRYRGSLSEVNRYRYQENGTQETKADWPTALLNTIHLNHNFLGTFSQTWQNKIVDYKWHYVGGIWANIGIGSKTSANTIRTSYDYEVGKNSDKTLSEPTKIGLMYVNDYLYAASPNNWQLKPYNGIDVYQSGDPDSEGNPQGTYDGTDYRSAIDENWMYMGLWEWTITQRTDDFALGVHVFYLRAPGYVALNTVGAGTYVVRPCFYLTSTTQIKSGGGTRENPYRIN